MIETVPDEYRESCKDPYFAIGWAKASLTHALDAAKRGEQERAVCSIEMALDALKLV